MYIDDASLSEGRQPVTPIDGASGMRGRRCAQAVPERKVATPEACVAPAREASSASARAASGLRPGTLRSPVRSWLTWMNGAPAGEDARPGMGRNRKAGSGEATSPSAKCAARRREPAPNVRAKPPHGSSGQTPRWSAGRRAGPVMAGHLWPGLAGDGPYRETGHGCARTTRTSVSLRSISPRFFRG
jgi:hypothetical protein